MCYSLHAKLSLRIPARAKASGIPGSIIDLHVSHSFTACPWNPWARTRFKYKMSDTRNTKDPGSLTSERTFGELLSFFLVRRLEGAFFQCLSNLLVLSCPALSLPGPGWDWWDRKNIGKNETKFQVPAGGLLLSRVSLGVINCSQPHLCKSRQKIRMCPRSGGLRFERLSDPGISRILRKHCTLPFVFFLEV